MPAKLAERLAGIVQDAVRRGTQDLPARLSQAGFAPALCRLIPLVLPLTLVGLEDPAGAANHVDVLKGVDQFDADDFDSVAVAIMYNMINRVSNGLAITPEWSAWRRPAWLLRLSRRPAAWLLRQAMSFDKLEGDGESDKWLGKLGSLLETEGLAPLPGSYQHLAQAPHLAEALCRLLAASSAAASLDAATRRAVDRAVLLQLGAGRLLAPDEAAADPSRESGGPATIDRADACRGFAVRLTARPWSTTAAELGTLRESGLSEAEILDVVFRIAVLNGLGRLDRVFSA